MRTPLALLLSLVAALAALALPRLRSGRDVDEG